MTLSPEAREEAVRLANDLRQYSNKTVGSLRIGVDEIALIVQALDAFSADTRASVNEIEAAAERIWQEDSVRAAGRRRLVTWSEAGEGEQERFRWYARAVLEGLSDG